MSQTEQQQPVTAASDAGPREPTSSVPPRALGSVRRTSTIDVLRPDGPTGPVQFDGRARDLVTDQQGGTTVRGEAKLEGRATAGRALTEIATDPPRPQLAELVGQSVAAGFRARAAALVPEDRVEQSLINLLLDDLPVASLVSGYSMQRAGVVGRMPSEYRPTVDLCSGWRADGVLMTVLNAEGWVPMTLGPKAPPLEPADDPLAWHTVGPLVPGGVRRRRRLDLTRADGDTFTVDAAFRDTYADPDGHETVVHEYTVQAQIAPASDAFTGLAERDQRTHRESLAVAGVEATARVLPYIECPSAALSAARLVGEPVSGLREHVRADFVGISTCTHLNDLFRSLADVAALAGSIR